MKDGVSKGNLAFKKAESLLNKLYQFRGGMRTKIKRYENYIKLIRIAAYKGHSGAQFELGQTYEDFNFFGENSKCDFKKCNYWYTKACSQGHAASCNSLAYGYDAGRGVSINKRKALSLYKKAARLGDPLAKGNIRLVEKEQSKKHTYKLSKLRRRR
jgi:TPR repeat protein